MDILEQFTKDNIIKNLSAYDVYYQVSLGWLINETKRPNIDSTVDFSIALGSIFELLIDIKKLNNAKEIFKTELQKQSAMDAVQHFVNENLELIKEQKIEVEPIINQINDDKFFNDTMIKICESEIKLNQNKWKNIVTDDIADSIYREIKELLK